MEIYLHEKVECTQITINLAAKILAHLSRAQGGAVRVDDRQTIGACDGTSSVQGQLQSPNWRMCDITIERSIISIVECKDSDCFIRIGEIV
jgi:hypothetical protein